MIRQMKQRIVSFINKPNLLAPQSNVHTENVTFCQVQYLPCYYFLLLAFLITGGGCYMQNISPVTKSTFAESTTNRPLSVDSVNTQSQQF